MAKTPLPSTIGINPLDALMPLSATLAAIRPQRSTREKSTDVRTVALTVNLSPALFARVQGIVGITMGMSVDSLFEQAINRHLDATGARSARPGSTKKGSTKKGSGKKGSAANSGARRRPKARR